MTPILSPGYYYAESLPSNEVYIVLLVEEDGELFVLVPGMKEKMPAELLHGILGPVPSYESTIRS